MKNEVISLCPHCGNRSSHFVLADVDVDEMIEGWDSSFNIQTAYFNATYFILKCRSCDGTSIYCCYDGEEIGEANQIYPESKHFKNVVPQCILAPYLEAKKVKRISPAAFIVMIRRALEILCENNDAKGNNLKQKIEDLGNKGIIPEKIGEMAEALREYGNIVAHSKEELEFDFLDAEFLDDLFVVMIEYIYVAPSKLDNLRRKFESKKSERRMK